VGRTSFWGPLTEWKDGRLAREAAVREIARRYREWVDIFEAAGGASAAPAREGAEHEQASVFGWAKSVGARGQSIGMRSFGASAPLKDLQGEFGFTAERVVEAAKAQLGGVRT
jgi:transketolase